MDETNERDGLARSCKRVSNVLEASERVCGGSEGGRSPSKPAQHGLSIVEMSDNDGAERERVRGASWHDNSLRRGTWRALIVPIREKRRCHARHMEKPIHNRVLLPVAAQERQGRKEKSPKGQWAAQPYCGHGQGTWLSAVSCSRSFMSDGRCRGIQGGYKQLGTRATAIVPS
jgi:hypothetical protein